MAHTVRLGPQGRIVLPAALRRSLGLRPGDELTVIAEDGRIVLETRDELMRRLRGELRPAGRGRSVVDELIAERRREAARERE